MEIQQTYSSAIDLYKAFDKVNHNALYIKLSHENALYLLNCWSCYRIYFQPATRALDGTTRGQKYLR